jgi:predicted tellurium resistance membrane protein TerC
MGLRALFELVSAARESVRYMDQTIAVLLALVGVKLLAARVLHVSPLASLLGVLVVLGSGVALSLRAERRASRSSLGACGPSCGDSTSGRNGRIDERTAVESEESGY